MSKAVVPIHGADHCPGGPDPIPCLGDLVGGFTPDAIDWITSSGAGNASETLQTITPDSYVAVNPSPIGPSFDINEDNVPLIARRGLYLAKVDIDIAPAVAFQTWSSTSVRYLDVELGVLSPNPSGSGYFIFGHNKHSTGVNGTDASADGGSFYLSHWRLYMIPTDPTPCTPTVRAVWRGAVGSIAWESALTLIRIGPPLIWNNGVIIGDLDDIG